MGEGVGRPGVSAEPTSSGQRPNNSMFFPGQVRRTSLAVMVGELDETREEGGHESQASGVTEGLRVPRDLRDREEDFETVTGISIVDAPGQIPVVRKLWARS